MRFVFGRKTCGNPRVSLQGEWLETNGLGDYASGSVPGCNTRRYHGLLVADLAQPAGRHVLLSAMEESLLFGSVEHFFSCRRHPDVFFPQGYECLHEFSAGPWPMARWRFGDAWLVRELLMVPGKTLVILRYTLSSAAEMNLAEPPILRIKPLLAFRNAHSLTYANEALSAETWSVPSGMGVRPYLSLPPLYIQVSGAHSFQALPAWCRRVCYPVEAERGFPDEEDLFQPGVFDIRLEPGVPVYVSASTSALDKPREQLRHCWKEETGRRLALEARIMRSAPAVRHPGRLEAHLAAEGRKFLVQDAGGGAGVVAGYPWFGVWGRDTCISLAGLTFCAGRFREGAEVLRRLAGSVKNGLIPNCFSEDGLHAYNSVDASLWFVWAVQHMDRFSAEGRDFVRRVCWPALKQVVRAYQSGSAPYVRPDAAGFLLVGNPDTQLTWMDASVNGRPVTPRYGAPVEISALWYNALAFAQELGRRFGEDGWECEERLASMREVFLQRYFVQEQGCLADVWREEGRDCAIRPNQVFALALPHSVLEPEYRAQVMDAVRSRLLTPFGLRTLAPGSAGYRPAYEGGPEARDSSYHQGTVWPWLLGAYTDALVKTAWDAEGAVKDLLETITPMFTEHLGRYGIGSIAEIFDADAPYRPNGCPAQAWSVAEVMRALMVMRMTAPGVFAEWEERVLKRVPFEQR
ncbi:MAG: glycogen debranching enzyme N-terminal domain-containing protein [Desulfovibrionaceae bacterium]|nr:glycogen debranching enzyme N-terminal domain-containing protein [Desulfovibrionaceae bacterium]